MEQALMEYPDYSNGGYYGLESYLLRAEQMGADPIFLKIMRLRELTNEDKNAFINIYCDASFMRQMKGSHHPQYHHPSESREVESFAAEPDDSQYVRDRFGTLPGKSKLIVGPGGKSRRRSNRKSRRKNRKFP
jgi:hypothetical protein